MDSSIEKRDHVINVELASRLIGTVGPIDIFYERCFAARPDLMKTSRQDVASRSILVIYAPTAAQASEVAARTTTTDKALHVETLSFANAQRSDLLGHKAPADHCRTRSCCRKAGSVSSR